MTVEEALTTLEAILGKQSLNDLQETIFRACWEQKSYPEIAQTSGYDAEYIKLVGFQLWKKLSEACGEKITKNNFRSVLRRQSQFFTSSNIGEREETRQSIHNLSCAGSAPKVRPKIQNQISWGEAIDVSVFFGRERELEILSEWIIRDRCRLVAILGIGGTGKTALSVKLAEQIQKNFDFVIWRSLHNAPSIHLLLTNLIEFLSEGKATKLPADTDSKISQFIEYLQKQHCLIIFDNLETILSSAIQPNSSNCKAGYYREGYEKYGKLLQRIGETRHQSCLILTSREKPKEIAAFAGESFSVRNLSLSGLTTAAAQEIFKAKGHFIGGDRDWQALIQSYGGNPLALKIVATTISDLFAGNIERFLAQGTAIFGDIQDLLQQQFSRLSSLEGEIVYWLAINREPVALAELQADLLSPLSTAEILESLESLARRSLIEKGTTVFTLQPVLMEYVTERLITQVCQELETQSPTLYKTHALIKAQTKNYLQDIQNQLILKPVANRLLRVFGDTAALDRQLMQILASLQRKIAIQSGYAAGNTLNLLLQLQINLGERDFSHLTVWQADLRGANLQRVNFSYSNLAKSTFTENLGYIFAMTVNRDGILATADSYSQIRLWQVEEGQQILAWSGHKGWTRALSFSPDGKILASGCDDRTVHLWDVSTGQRRQVLPGHAGWVLFVAFSQDGKFLASSSEDKTIKLWNIQTNQCYRTFGGHTAWVCYVAFSCDGRIASASADRTLKLWDIETGQCLKTIQAHDNVIGFVTFSADGQTLVSASEDQTIKLWDIKTGKCKKTLPAGHKGWVWWSAVALSGDNQTLAIGDADSCVKLWDISTGQFIRSLQHSSGIRTIVFSHDGQTLIGAHEDQTLKLWDVSDGRCLKTFQGYSSGIWAIAFSPDRKTLFTGGADQMLKVWNVADGKCLRIFKGHSDLVRSVTYSPQGNTLASGGGDGTIRLWDISDGRCIKTFGGHTNWVMSVAYNPDGQTLASGSLDQTVRIWDIDTGQCLRVLQAHNSLSLSVAYSPDGQTLASCGADYTVKLWDVATGECLKALPGGHSNWVYAIAFSPDGQTLASGGVDGAIAIWHLRNNECLRVLRGHNSWVVSLAYSPQGNILASGSLDGTVRMWNVASGECLRVLQGHTSWVLSVTFTHLEDEFSNRQIPVLASGSDDRSIRFWDLETGKCTKILRNERPYEGMNITGTIGLTPAQKATLKVLGAIDVSIVESRG